MVISASEGGIVSVWAPVDESSATSRRVQNVAPDHGHEEHDDLGRDQQRGWKLNQHDDDVVKPLEPRNGSASLRFRTQCEMSLVSLTMFITYSSRSYC